MDHCYGHRMLDLSCTVWVLDGLHQKLHLSRAFEFMLTLRNGGFSTSKSKQRSVILMMLKDLIFPQ